MTSSLPRSSSLHGPINRENRPLLAGSYRGTSLGHSGPQRARSLVPRGTDTPNRVTNESQDETDAYLSSMKERLNHSLDGLSSELDAILSKELGAWINTTLAYCGDNSLIEDIKDRTQLCKRAANMFGASSPYPKSDTMHFMTDETEEKALCLQEREMVQRTKTLLVHQTTRADSVRDEVERAREENLSLKQRLQELERQVEKTQMETRQLYHERCIDLELPLQMIVSRQSKEVFTFEFSNLTNESNRVFTVTVNTAECSCQTNPYCNEVEKLWARMTPENRNEWNWQWAVYHTRRLFLEDITRSGRKKRNYTGASASGYLPKRPRGRNDTEGPSYGRPPPAPSGDGAVSGIGGMLGSVLRATSDWMGLGGVTKKH